MKKRIILHIGHGKTGSSYLQSCLALNRDKLLRIGIDYPWHPSFTKATSGYITIGNGFKFPKNLLNLNTESETVAFSSEFLFTHLPASTQFKDLLEGGEYHFEVLLYTRNLFEMKFSSWGQSVKRGGNTLDLNTTLLEYPHAPYSQCLEWLKLSEEFKFKLLIRNYSNHKQDLAQRFFYDLTGNEDFPLEVPQSTNVNRSLTSAELNCQRVVNSLKLGKPNLSDRLVQELPNLKPSNIKCSRKAYDLVLAKNVKHIESLNQSLDDNETVQIEPPQEVTCSEIESIENSLEQKQVNIIANHLSKHLVSEVDSEPDMIQEIAVKISKNSTDLGDALCLMKMALKRRPGSRKFNKIIDKWEQKMKKASLDQKSDV